MCSIPICRTSSVNILLFFFEELLENANVVYFIKETEFYIQLQCFRPHLCDTVQCADARVMKHMYIHEENL